MQRKERIQRFVGEIWQWYARHKRKLPWRDLTIADDTHRAYMILVSEVMLQQTQVPRVSVIFKQFIERFPTIKHLAMATNRDVLIAWRGMGYNSRALRLRDAAMAIVGDVALRGSQRVMVRCSKAERRSHEPSRCSHLRVTPCSFPRSIEELLSIPGIGPYTAAAIRNFAFNLATPCVDVNIGRILTRVFGLQVKKRVEEKAEEVLRVALEAPHPNPLPRGDGTSAAWHAALMDFGSVICTKRSPKCAKCPLSKGICKSAFRVQRAMVRRAHHDTAGLSRMETRGGPKNEPGRFVGSRFIPNRIFRGRVVDLLRDHPQGLTLERIGRHICLDWSQEQRIWLRDILRNLCRDSLIHNRGRTYALF